MRTVTVHIEDVPVTALTDALIAIELADSKGVFDDDQHERLTSLVLGLRVARDEGELPDYCLSARLDGPDHQPYLCQHEKGHDGPHLVTKGEWSYEW